MDDRADSLASMTGFGQSAADVGGWRLQVACRSVNHDRLSIRIHGPDELGWLEPKINDRIDAVVSRGRVEVRVDLEPGVQKRRPEFDCIDEDRFEAVVSELKRLAIDHRLVTPVSLEAVWEYREFFDRTSGEVLSETDAGPILETFDEALDEMVRNRRDEGEAIRRDLRELIESFSAQLEEVDELRDEGREAERTRARARLREALEEFELDEIDEGRLTQEVAYYVEKGDIAEEVQRAEEHADKLGGLLDEASSPVGKKIDFYLQELIRETNTMSSKSRYTELTERVIEMKSLVEKMREQAANVE